MDRRLALIACLVFASVSPAAAFGQVAPTPKPGKAGYVVTYNRKGFAKFSDGDMIHSYYTKDYNDFLRYVKLIKSYHGYEITLARDFATDDQYERSKAASEGWRREASSSSMKTAKKPAANPSLAGTVWKVDAPGFSRGNVTFEFRANGVVRVNGRSDDFRNWREGTWRLEGNRLSIVAGAWTFTGVIDGNSMSGKVGDATYAGLGNFTAKR